MGVRVGMGVGVGVMCLVRGCSGAPGWAGGPAAAGVGTLWGAAEPAAVTRRFKQETGCFGWPATNVTPTPAQPSTAES